ncbi:hypothetical protein C8R44DRAFT_888196 [Mycena epipterygia]|nr:hypothetical protein C8R44DRAFT_896412 [Mycena epipterygia]KAJ7100351.1 hypothetical protein C8R44DRAFT_888196 [Mycena epipterygia]
MQSNEEYEMGTRARQYSSVLSGSGRAPHRLDLRLPHCGLLAVFHYRLPSDVVLRGRIALRMVFLNREREHRWVAAPQGTVETYVRFIARSAPHFDALFIHLHFGFSSLFPVLVLSFEINIYKYLSAFNTGNQSLWFWPGSDGSTFAGERKATWSHLSFAFYLHPGWHLKRRHSNWLTTRAFGLWISNQQFTIRNVKISNASIAVNCGVGFVLNTGGLTLATQNAGGVLIIDLKIPSTGIGIRMSSSQATSLGGSLILHNVAFSGITTVNIQDRSVTVVAANAGMEPEWFQGNVYLGATKRYLRGS